MEMLPWGVWGAQPRPNHALEADELGDIVLVHAAAGGVGGFAVQLAKAAKAFVIGTCSPANKRYVLELGADEVIDYRTEDVFSAQERLPALGESTPWLIALAPATELTISTCWGRREDCLYCGASRSSRCTRPSLFHLDSRHRLGGVLVSPAFRRRQEDLGRMATELMTRCRTVRSSPPSQNKLPWNQFRRHWSVSPRGMFEAKSLPQSQTRSAAHVKPCA
jgi:NADPH:quinone reductase-like Zn-dependent oxidoreductase